MKKIIIIFCSLLFAGSSLAEGKAVLPFDLSFGMTKAEAIEKLNVFHSLIIKNENNELVYLLPSQETGSITSMHLSFNAKKLVRYSSYKTGIPKDIYPTYSNNFVTILLEYQKHGYVLIVEDKLNNIIILSNQNVYVIASHGLSESGKNGYAEIDFYEKNYAKKTKPFFEKLKD